MSQSELEALLGRSLTPAEVTNLDLYLNIATENLEQLLCMVLTETSGEDDARLYDAREGYSTLFVDIFTELNEVQIDGDIIPSDKYSVRQWDRRNGTWYNSIVFSERFSSDKEVQVSANWGFATMPVDLQSVLAGLFDLVTKKSKLDPSVTQKQVEDFRIHLNADVDLDTEFYKKYAKTISKYSLCEIGNVKNGEVKQWKAY